MGKSLKRKSIHVVPGVEVGTQVELVEYLKKHPLIQACSLEMLRGQPGIGKLVWAKNPGSVFWPALIARFDDKPEHDATEPDQISPNDYRCVMFLEKTFRFAVLQWKDLILVQEKRVEDQDALVSKYNRFIIKKTWRPEKAYKDAVDLLKDFIPLEISLRQAHAFSLSIERKQTKTNERAEKIAARPRSQKTDQESQSLLDKSSPSDRKRSNPNYGLRPSISKKISGTESPTSPSSSTKCSTPVESSSTHCESEGVETSSDISRKAKTRPKVGGAPMKKFVEERFLSVDKSFRVDTKNKKENWKCATCFADIEPGSQVMCHDLPHHKSCLQIVETTQKDGSSLKLTRCSLCIEKSCFNCRMKVKGKELPTKCSKCDLWFHRSCLLNWPQAEIQGSSGPITCPVHFCHTCLGEQKVFNRMRNFKAFSGGKYRCLQCLSTYHKPCCVPAGSLETVSGKDFIICPKHTLPDIKISQRRFGCLSCGEILKSKEVNRVECNLCLQIFHPKCVGYTDKEEESGMPLNLFAKDYRCVSCLWGLYPLYGQVVWFQQTGHPFWPARIMFPRESVGRIEYGATRAVGEYSLKYYAAQPSYYDKASRTFPLHLTTVKMFTNLNIYQETGKVKAAYEEASFFHQLVEDLRDSRLSKPEPFYKKIERNIYRNGFVATRKKLEATGACYCADRKDSDVCTQNSECHNRDTAVECNDKNCLAGNRCRNRMFSKKLKDADNTEQFLSASKGWAVKAKRAFKQGDFVIEYCGEIINNGEMQYRANKKSEEDPLYLLEIDKNTFIDAEFCGNVSRLINHSCEPNCQTEKYTSDGRPVVGVFARTDIEKGEELTFDYAYGNESAAPFRCHCGTETCRGYVGKETSEEIVCETANPDLEKYDKQCYKCTYGGYVLCCDFEGCFKVYHKSCAELTREPENEWYCPDHKVKPKVGKKRRALKNGQIEPPSKKSCLESRKSNESLSTSEVSKKRASVPKPEKVKRSVKRRRVIAKKSAVLQEDSSIVLEDRSEITDSPVNGTVKCEPAVTCAKSKDSSKHRSVGNVSRSCLKCSEAVSCRCSGTSVKSRDPKTITVTDKMLRASPILIVTNNIEGETMSESRLSNLSTISGESTVEEVRKKGRSHWSRSTSAQPAAVNNSLATTPRSERLAARRRMSTPAIREALIDDFEVKNESALNNREVDIVSGTERVAEWLRHSENEEPPTEDYNPKDSKKQINSSSCVTLEHRETSSLDSTNIGLGLDVPSPLSVRPEKNILTTMTGADGRKSQVISLNSTDEKNNKVINTTEDTMQTRRIQDFEEDLWNTYVSVFGEEPNPTKGSMAEFWAEVDELDWVVERKKKIREMYLAWGKKEEEDVAELRVLFDQLELDLEF